MVHTSLIFYKKLNIFDFKTRTHAFCHQPPIQYLFANRATRTARFHFTMAAQQQQQLKDLQLVYLGLGGEKWREHIDLADQTHGRLVYDECLHNGNGQSSIP